MKLARKFFDDRGFSSAAYREVPDCDDLNTEGRITQDGKNLLLDSETAGDEPYMLASNLKDVVVLVDKDRVKSGRYAIERFGCDTLLLDDGFQYWKLRGRRHDVVLIDRQQPFGNEQLLPRGTLREPPSHLSCAWGEIGSRISFRLPETRSLISATERLRISTAPSRG